MSANTTADIRLFKDLPRRKVRKSIMEPLCEFREASIREGGLLPFATTASIIGVSRQRVQELVNERTFVPFDAYGKRWLSANQIIQFIQLQRKVGRPRKDSSNKEIFKTVIKSQRKQAED